MNIKKTQLGFVLSGKVITSLDRFVFDMVRIIGSHTPYVIVSGYVAILLGRSRGTEDVDMLIPLPDFETFSAFYDEMLNSNYEFLNAEDKGGLYQMLCSQMAIRAAESGSIIPNMEIKAMKTEYDYYSFSSRIEMMINEIPLSISPLELQIAYKLDLGSDKDIEDAVYLWEICHDLLDTDLFSRFCHELQVHPEDYGIGN
jgi:hypothetical protein